MVLSSSSPTEVVYFQAQSKFVNRIMVCDHNIDNEK